MLGHDAVRRGAMGPVLAQHLLEHLPFEEDPDAAVASVAAVAAAGLLAALLVCCASAEGQGFLRALALALEKPPTHDATFRVLDLAAAWFADARDAPALPGVPPQVHAAVTALAATGRAAAEPILGRTTAVGPLMRRHLAPVLQPLLQHLQVLRTTS
jgi:hypothetical protein